MTNEKQDQNQKSEKPRNEESAAASQSSVDRRNEGAIRDTPSATDRVKPRAGDGLANEGTNVSYGEER